MNRTMVDLAKEIIDSEDFSEMEKVIRDLYENPTLYDKNDVYEHE